MQLAGSQSDSNVTQACAIGAGSRMFQASGGRLCQISSSRSTPGTRPSPLATASVTVAIESAAAVVTAATKIRPATAHRDTATTGLWARR